MFTIEIQQNDLRFVCELFFGVSQCYAIYFQKYAWKYFTDYDVKIVLWYFTIFYVMLHANIRHNTTYVYFSSLTASSGLFRIAAAIVLCFLAAFLPMPALARSSGTRLAPLWSQRAAASCHCRAQVHFNVFDDFVTVSTLVLYAELLWFCWHFSLDLS